MDFWIVCLYFFFFYSLLRIIKRTLLETKGEQNMKLYVCVKKKKMRSPSVQKEEIEHDGNSEERKLVEEGT